MTFTQAEVAPYVGIACTLDLINSDRGGWGWLTMDNVVIPGSSTSPDPFVAWMDANYPSLSDKSPTGDPDHDGMTNQQEFAFGLDPSSATSANPIVTPLNKTTGIFRYTRRDPAVSCLTYTVTTSTNLSDWVPDIGATASQSVISTNGDIQTVEVTITGAPLGSSKWFVRVKAE